MRVTPQAVVGLLIVVVGLLLTAGNVGWVPPARVDQILRYYPLAIMTIGLAKILSSDSSSGRLFGGLIMFIGLWLAGNEFYGVRVYFWSWWPLVLVFFGVLMISRAFERRRDDSAGMTAGSITPGNITAESTAAGTTADERLSAWAFWSGIKRRITSPAFKRADLTAIMGGVVIDLRAAGTGGGEAVIDVFVLWGGVEVMVPPDWSVSNHVVAIMGGVDDKSTGTQEARHRLVIRGFVIMGGVEIKT